MFHVKHLLYRACNEGAWLVGGNKEQESFTGLDKGGDFVGYSGNPDTRWVNASEIARSLGLESFRIACSPGVEPGLQRGASAENRAFPQWRYSLGTDREWLRWYVGRDQPIAARPAVVTHDDAEKAIRDVDFGTLPTIASGPASTIPASIRVAWPPHLDSPFHVKPSGATVLLSLERARSYNPAAPRPCVPRDMRNRARVPRSPCFT